MQPLGIRRHPPLVPSAWTSGPGARVLIEHHDPAIGNAAGNLLAAEGFEVSTCAGPDVQRRRRCPLATGADCPNADGTDVVLFGLDISDEDDREILRAWRARHDDVAVIVEMPAARIPLYQDELDGCVALPRPMTRDSLLDAVGRALR